jgi:hypothetical protein
VQECIVGKSRVEFSLLQCSTGPGCLLTAEIEQTAQPAASFLRSPGQRSKARATTLRAGNSLHRPGSSELQMGKYPVSAGYRGFVI